MRFAQGSAAATTILRKPKFRGGIDIPTDLSAMPQRRVYDCSLCRGWIYYLWLVTGVIAAVFV